MSTEFDGRGIGGTDIAPILGVSKWRSQVDVFRRIVEGYETPDAPQFRRGRALEPAIRELAAAEYGLRLLGPRKIRQDWRRASLDDEAQGDGAVEVVEYKSSSWRNRESWGEEGTDAVPQDYLLQCHWYLGMTGAPRAQLVVLLGGEELRRYIIPADPELYGLIHESAERFWVDHIQARRPPPVDGSESCAEWLKARFPESNGQLLTADNRLAGIASDLAAARRRKEEAEADEARARNLLIEAIGEADGIEGPGWRVTYRQTKGRESTDWAAIAAACRIEKSLIAMHTKRTPYRVFKLTQEKK